MSYYMKMEAIELAKDAYESEENCEERIYNEGGMNWAWFTKLRIVGDRAVRILKYWRLHKDEEWPEECMKAPYHPAWHHSEKWKETGASRIATEYNLPDLGWCRIVNPKYIFDYIET